MSLCNAPWSEEVIARLNRWQACNFVHSFTCLGMRSNGKRCLQRDLAATPDGWVCACGTYKQDWAHSSMAEREPPTFESIFGQLAADLTRPEKSEAP